MKRRDFIALLGGAAAWPLAARAQRQAMPVVGFLSGTREGPLTATIRQGLAEQGYVEGRNVEIVYRWAELQYDRLPTLAADLVRRDVAVIIATGGANTVQAAKSATSTIPIVFATGADPVELGLSSSLNRPGGNITGVTFLGQALTAKRLELLHDMLPAAKTIGFLVNSTTPQAKAQVRDAESAAQALGVRLTILDARTQGEIERDLAILVGHRIDAFLAGDDPLFSASLAALLARYALPAVHHLRATVDAGGLMSYGADLSDAYRLAGRYAGRILKGEKPGDLPVQQSTKVELIVNLKTAKALGIDVPTSILLRADEVIE
jgi:putative ABC transport system substrate-binding protein